MRQEALKRHLRGKSFPITSIKNTGPSGRRLSKMPNLKALIKLVFWAADTSFPTTCKAAKTDSQGNSRSLQLWKQSLLCCGLQEFLGDLSFLNTSLSNKKWWSAMDGSNFFFLLLLFPLIALLHPALLKANGLPKTKKLISWNQQIELLPLIVPLTEPA